LSGQRTDPEYRLEEACGLATALELEVAESQIINLRAIQPGQFFGKGKLDELKELIAAEEVNVTVIDAPLTPVQQRNLERALNCKVLDRTGLILEIFALRARTREGRLQVELARLTYERSRLVRTWTHLERQRGGRGFLAGPGETQIEADRRMLADKMGRLRRELEEVRRTRSLHRKQRNRTPYPLVALIGYTNAGKSTLFNVLTNSRVLAKDMVFATLDPTARALDLPQGTTAMLFDTVGFISELPPELVEAFKATLEEVLEADIILHVRDIAHASSDEQAEDVRGILERLNAGQAREQTVLEVWNKIDLLDDEDRDIAMMQARSRGAAAISATRGTGLPALLEQVEALVNAEARAWHVRLGPADGKALAWLHENGQVLERIDHDDGTITLEVRLTPLSVGRFEASHAKVAVTLASA
jgi:GTP-binding protein HflX